MRIHTNTLFIVFKSNHNDGRGVLWNFGIESDADWLGQPRSLVIYITCHNCLLESSFPHMSISFSAISGQRSLKLRHKRIGI